VVVAGSEPLVRTHGWLAGEGRARQNVAIRIRPGRMIPDVESLQPELERVLLAVRYPEFLVRVKIQRKDARPDQSVPRPPTTGQLAGSEARVAMDGTLVASLV
jgi:hypothetical protein